MVKATVAWPVAGSILRTTPPPPLPPPHPAQITLRLPSQARAPRPSAMLYEAMTSQVSALALYRSVLEG